MSTIYDSLLATVVNIVVLVVKMVTLNMFRFVCLLVGWPRSRIT